MLFYIKNWNYYHFCAVKYEYIEKDYDVMKSPISLFAMEVRFRKTEEEMIEKRRVNKLKYSINLKY